VNAAEFATKLREKFGELVTAPAEFRGEITVKIADAERIAEVCSFAKKELGFDYLVDITSIDNYGEDPRWTIVYHLYGYGHRCHLRLKTDVSEEKSELPTITGVWRTADWHERETYDLLGIVFTGHPDSVTDATGIHPRRILLPDDWAGFPLRKDYVFPREYEGIPGSVEIEWEQKPNYPK